MLNTLPKGKITIEMCDFNAKVGKEDFDQVLRNDRYVKEKKGN